MIDERFTPAAFERLLSDRAAVERLCHTLGTEIAAEMHGTVEIAFRRVAERLRRLGHELPERAPEVGAEYNSRGYAYRLWESMERERHKLRIHFDTQVCVFFPGADTTTAACPSDDSQDNPQASEHNES